MLEVREREPRVKPVKPPPLTSSHFSALPADDLTLPFSNLLTLFLLVTMSLSPVSPSSPMMLRKTLASVPLPPTLPVQMVTRYFSTETEKTDSRLVAGHLLELAERFLTGQRLGNERSGRRKLSDDLIVVLVHVQPAAALKQVFFHRQGFQQGDLRRIVAVGDTHIRIVEVIYLSGSVMKLAPE